MSYSIRAQARRVTRGVHAAIFVIALCEGPALAQVVSTFDFDFTFVSSYSGDGGYGSLVGSFTATGGAGSYTITSVQGTLGGQTITLLAPMAFAGNDNALYYPANPGYFTLGGVSFAMKGVDYNLYYYQGLYGITTVDSLNEGAAYTGTVTLDPAPGPIPGAGLMSFVGLGISSLAMRFRAGVDFLRRAVSLTRARRRPPATAYGETA